MTRTASVCWRTVSATASPDTPDMSIRRYLLPFSQPRMWVTGCALLVGGGVWVAAHAQGSSIYTCVDSKGRRLTSDRPIVECLDREQHQLGNTGKLQLTGNGQPHAVITGGRPHEVASVKSPNWFTGLKL